MLDDALGDATLAEARLSIVSGCRNRVAGLLSLHDNVLAALPQDELANRYFDPQYQCTVRR